MGRTLLGIVLGMLAMWLTTFSVEFASHALYPPPPGLDPRDPKAMEVILATSPKASLALLVLAWALGAFVGGWVAGRIARHPRIAATCVALLVIFGVVGMIVMFPGHPRWVSTLGLLLPIPAALLGATLAQWREKTLPK